MWVSAAFVALAASMALFASVDRVPGWPGPDAPSYEQLAENLAGGDGYRVDIEGEPEGSRYPPGFPIVLAVLGLFADVTIVAVLMGMALAVAVWWSAWKGGGPMAAAVAVVLVAAYMPRHEYAGAVMADTTGALLVVLALLALQYGRPVLAGLLAGFGVWVKLAHVVIVAGLPRRAMPAFVVMLIGLVVTKVAWDWGYGGDHAQWGLSHVFSTEGLVDRHHSLPNVLAYPLMLLGLHQSITVPGAAILAAWSVWRRPERRFVLPFFVGLLAVYLPYFFQDDRFMFPAAALIAVYAGVGVADILVSVSGENPDTPGVVVPVAAKHVPGHDRVSGH